MAHVVTRFPPSPTGHFHIGSARTLLFNALFAAKNGGVMYLRFEDTDKERSKKEFEEAIVEGVRWLGITYSLPEVYRQSERTELYKNYLQRLIASGAAYEAEAGTDNPEKKVVRFKNPNTTILFSDMVRGDVSFDTTDLKDFVIAKNLDEPLYHLAVVVDDHEMAVTHVIRGEDHISNTPRQILILEALGFKRPQYAHIPLILAPDKSKLSKRHGAVSIHEYRQAGYLPEALINYLALLGWNPGTEQELFTFGELARAFEFNQVQKSGAKFDIEKLRWFNHEYIKRLSDDEFRGRLADLMGKPFHASLIPLLKERSRTLKEAADAITGGEYDFLDHAFDVPVELLLTGAKADASTVKKNLEKILELLNTMSESFTSESIKEAVFPYATERGRASVLWPLRVALSGREKSPDPFTIAGYLGKEKTIQRIQVAVEKLGV